MNKSKGNKIKAVIYARYSSDNQREKSIEGQICVNAKNTQGKMVCQF